MRYALLSSNGEAGIRRNSLREMLGAGSHKTEKAIPLSSSKNTTSENRKAIPAGLPPGNCELEGNQRMAVSKSRMIRHGGSLYVRSIADESLIKIDMTEEERFFCRRTCSNAGDPPCFELPALTDGYKRGDVIKPCAECRDIANGDQYRENWEGDLRRWADIEKSELPPKTKLSREQSKALGEMAHDVSAFAANLISDPNFAHMQPKDAMNCVVGALLNAAARMAVLNCTAQGRRPSRANWAESALEAIDAAEFLGYREPEPTDQEGEAS